MNVTVEEDGLNLVLIEGHDFSTFVSNRPRNQFRQIWEALNPYFAEPQPQVEDSESLSDA